MLKKVLLFLLAMTLCVTMIGCSNANNKAENDDENAPSNTATIPSESKIEPKCYENGKFTHDGLLQLYRSEYGTSVFEKSGEFAQFAEDNMGKIQDVYNSSHEDYTYMVADGNVYKIDLWTCVANKLDLTRSDFKSIEFATSTLLALRNTENELVIYYSETYDTYNECDSSALQEIEKLDMIAGYNPNRENELIHIVHGINTNGIELETFSIVKIDDGYVVQSEGQAKVHEFTKKFESEVVDYTTSVGNDEMSGLVTLDNGEVYFVDARLGNHLEKQELYVIEQPIATNAEKVVATNLDNQFFVFEKDNHESVQLHTIWSSIEEAAVTEVELSDFKTDQIEEIIMLAETVFLFKLNNDDYAMLDVYDYPVWYDEESDALKYPLNNGELLGTGFVGAEIVYVMDDGVAYIVLNDYTKEMMIKY